MTFLRTGCERLGNLRGARPMGSTPLRRRVRQPALVRDTDGRTLVGTRACPHWPIGEVARMAKSTLWATCRMTRKPMAAA